MALWIILGVVALVLIYVVMLYNRLVTLKNNREGAFADIDVQLLNRFDLVENLVNTVKGYTAYEKETLKVLTDARTFPSNLIAKQFGLSQVPFFELQDQTAKKTPKVEF